MNLRRLLVAAVAALTVATAGASAAQAASTGLSGAVTGSDGSLVPACVTVYDLDFGYVDSLCTETGDWTLPTVPDGEYKLDVVSQSGSWAGEWAHDALTFDAATVLTAPAVVNVQLDPAYTISGTVRQADGTPAEDVPVTAYALDGSIVSGAYSFGDGSFSLSVRGMDIKIGFGQGLDEAFFDGASTFESATVVTVDDDGLIIDLRFPPTTTVSGRVLSPSGSGVAGMCVRLIEPVEGTEIFTQDTCEGAAVTDAEGRYAITPDPWEVGQTRSVLTWDPRGRFAGTLAGGTRSPGSATPYELVGAVEVADVTVRRGAVLTGTAAKAGSGDGLAGICPTAYVGSAFVWGTLETCSSTTGTYSLRGLPAGTVTLALNTDISSGYASRWYDNAASQADATPLRLSPGQQRTLATQVYLAPGVVTGRVVNASGKGMAGALVDFGGAYSAQLGGCEGPLCATTDSTGRYRITLPPGTYTPLVSDVAGRFAAAFSGGVVVKAKAKAVVVTSGGRVSQNFSVRLGGRIGGTFEATDYRPGIARVLSGPGVTIGVLDIGQDGTITSSRLLAGRYKVALEGSGILYDGTSSTNWASGLWIEVKGGQTTSITWHQSPMPTG